MKRWAFLLSCYMACAPISAKEITLASDVPQQYTVQEGDSLWLIAKRFLQDPELWTQVWQSNPNLKNPDLIYPGDVIHLKWRSENGTLQPILTLERGDTPDDYVVKLSPQTRVSALPPPIPTIPVSIIKPLLNDSLIVDKKDLEEAPYVFTEVEPRLIMGAGDSVYVRGDLQDDVSEYRIFRSGEAYRHPKTKEILGYQAEYVGLGRVTQRGDPVRVKILKSKKEVYKGDRLIQKEKNEVKAYFKPSFPKENTEGYIIDVLDGLLKVGQYQVVVLTGGNDIGREVGNVLQVAKYQRTVFDKKQFEKDEDDEHANIKLPREVVGKLIVFRVFEKTSFALVMEATQVINILDQVSNS